VNPSTVSEIDSAFRGALRLRLGQIGIVMLAAIAAIRYAAGQPAAATVDLVWAIALVGSLAWLRWVRNSAALGTFMAAVSVGGSLAKIHLLGATGVAWMFPIVLGTFAVTTRVPAGVVSGIGVAWATVAAFVSLGLEMALSVSISLGLTYVVALVTTTHVESLRLRLEGLASRDALTGAGNRRALDSALAPLLADDAAEGTALALMDLDHFKAVNDQHGHSTGDRVLVEFAALVRRLTRPQDRLFRFGGEEFVLVMPLTPTAEALEVARRVNDAVRATIHVRQSPVTVSIGLAFARAGESVDALLARADAALYAAKSGGRDRVEMA
jgi:diguanylate cyclase (GGDEF)-like protein